MSLEKAIFALAEAVTLLANNTPQEIGGPIKPNIGGPIKPSSDDREEAKTQAKKAAEAKKKTAEAKKKAAAKKTADAKAKAEGDDEDFLDGLTDVEEEEEEVLTTEDVKKAIIKVAKTLSPKDSKDILAQFDAARIPDLTEDQYADVVAACREKLAEV